MTEMEPHSLSRTGHSIDTQGLLLELYRLTSIFLASGGFAELSINHGGDHHGNPINELLQLEENEIHRILITTAACARVIDDGQHFDLSAFNTSCGTLVNNTSASEDITDLSLREACNKIIHATKINFDVEESPPHLNPVIYLYGTKGDIPWKAALNIVKYATDYISTIIRHN